MISPRLSYSRHGRGCDRGPCAGICQTDSPRFPFLRKSLETNLIFAVPSQWSGPHDGELHSALVIKNGYPVERLQLAANRAEARARGSEIEGMGELFKGGARGIRSANADGQYNLSAALATAVRSSG
jgi:hypothetical protein